MYCKGCGEDLLHQRAGHCPACGREFLRDDPRTVAPRPLRLGRPEALAFWGALACCAVAAGGVVLVTVGPSHGSGSGVPLRLAGTEPHPVLLAAWMAAPLLLVVLVLCRVRWRRYGLRPASVLGGGLALLHLAILLATLGAGFSDPGLSLLMLPVWEMGVTAAAACILEWEAARATR